VDTLHYATPEKGIIYCQQLSRNQQSYDRIAVAVAVAPVEVVLIVGSSSKEKRVVSLWTLTIC